MRPRRLLLLSLPALMLISTIGTAPAAEDPAPSPAKPASTAPAAVDTAGVLKRLASDDWKQRQAAERELVRLGEEALPAIEEMLKSGGAKLDAETRARLEGARKRIGEDRATGPTYVTLHLKDAAPADALAAFSKAVHGSLRPYPDNLFEHGPWPKVTLDLDRAPFWDALRQLCDRLGVTPNGWNDGLRLMRGGDGDGQIDGPDAADGPFLIVANAVNRNQVVRLAKDPAAVQVEINEFSVQFSAFAEPKLSVISCAESVVLESAVDDRGNSLIPDGLSWE